MAGEDKILKALNRLIEEVRTANCISLAKEMYRTGSISREECARVLQHAAFRDNFNFGGETGVRNSSGAFEE